MPPFATGWVGSFRYSSSASVGHIAFFARSAPESRIRARTELTSRLNRRVPVVTPSSVADVLSRGPVAFDKPGNKIQRAVEVEMIYIYHDYSFFPGTDWSERTLRSHKGPTNSTNDSDKKRGRQRAKWRREISSSSSSSTQKGNKCLQTRKYSSTAAVPVFPKHWERQGIPIRMPLSSGATTTQ